jgi:hypothetical protein
MASGNAKQAAEKIKDASNEALLPVPWADYCLSSGEGGAEAAEGEHG